MPKGDVEMADARVEAPKSDKGASPEPMDEIVGELERQQKEAIAGIEEAEAAAHMPVPTADAKVRRLLRELGEVVTFFGEDKGHRRDRLKVLYSKGRVPPSVQAKIDAAGGKLADVAWDSDSEELPDKEFYTEGSPSLATARLALLKSSMAAAAAARANPAPAVVGQARLSLFESLTTYADVASQFLAGPPGSDPTLGLTSTARPFSSVAWAPDGSCLLTASWSGLLNAWDGTTYSVGAEYRGHTDRVQSVEWRPGSAAHFVSGGADHSVLGWAASSPTPQTRFEGHSARVNAVAWLGPDYVMSSSFDRSWRLWDAETGGQLLLQEGHGRGVYGLAAHPTGALVASGGLDGLVWVWDVRSGQAVASFVGHSGGVLDLDWSPNGTSLASASADHSIRIWDIRSRKVDYTIPAHSHLVSSVAFDKPSGGAFLVSTSFDRNIRIWAADTWTQLATLAGHSDKVTSVSIKPGGSPTAAPVLASASFDKQWKVWSPSRPRK